MRFISDILTRNHKPEFKNGKGPYACINEDDGSSWNLYHGSDGVSYAYGALRPY